MNEIAFCLSIVLATASVRGESPASQEKFVTADGVRLHYRNVGSGREALVFVHGWGGDGSVWDGQLAAFAEKTHLLLLDLPGHGGSGRPATPLSMDVFAESVAAVMKDAGVDRAVLIGHSMGTPVIRQFLRHHPEKTLALVAVDGALRKFQTTPEQLDKFVAPYRKPDYADAGARFIAAMFPVGANETIRDHDKAIVRKTSQSTMVESFQAMFDPKIWTDDPISVPLLVVNAKSSRWPADYEPFVRTISPGVDYRVLDDTGHFLMQEKPTEFNAILKEFLQKNGLLAAAANR